MPFQGEGIIGSKGDDEGKGLIADVDTNALSLGTGELVKVQVVKDDVMGGDGDRGKDDDRVAAGSTGVGSKGDNEGKDLIADVNTCALLLGTGTEVGA